MEVDKEMDQIYYHKGEIKFLKKPQKPHFTTLEIVTKNNRFYKREKNV